jgi:uncharacterized heparinase superfamily protein
LTVGRWRLARLALRARLRSWRLAFARLRDRLRPLRGLRADRLIVAPQDLRTADPTIAADIYAGYFAFAGKLATVNGQTPFRIEPPSRAWAEVLYGFGWLRHLRAADTPLARANARALVDDFITGNHARDPAASDPRVVARRVISLLSQAPLVLEGADHVFYSRYLRAIARDGAHLMRIVRLLDGEEKLTALVALAYLTLAMAGAEGWSKRVTRWLEVTLAQDILPDGGHVSRNIRFHLELIADLLPLREVYVRRGIEVPRELVGAIDRMIPMLRLFRHGDGSLALFNGMGLTPAGLVAALLAHDSAMGQPILHAVQSGYERLEAGSTVVVADCGAPPPVLHSREAHAGALAFEMSTGPYRLVVSCGVPRGGPAEIRQAVRATAAHSTLVIDDRSSARFLAPGGFGDRLGPVIIAGPETMPAWRGTREDGAQVLEMSQDGYEPAFALTHMRRLSLDATGERLSGIDSVSGEGRPEAPNAVLRFHLHPAVKASRLGDGHFIIMVQPNGETWGFETNAETVWLEDSMFFAAADGARRTSQIVVAFAAIPGTMVTWSFHRIGRAAPRAPRPRASGGDERLLEP